MSWARAWIRMGVLLSMAALGSGCVGDPDGVPGPADGELSGEVLVSAAASLTDAFVDLAAAVEHAHPDVDVALNLGGSATLREQLLEGAPADVFASADPGHMDAVVAARGVIGAPRTVAHNRLIIVVPRGNPAAVTGLDAFADEDLLLGLCAPSVPCGALAREALQEAGVAPAIDTNEPDVRALLTRVVAGELDAGIVYVTDAMAADGAVDSVAIPDELQARATYPIAVLADSRSPRAAATFVAFALGAEGQRILRAHGFGLP